jgi:hypothetical protein
VTDDEHQLSAELLAVEAEIDAAYWRFTRQARGVPPSIAVPHAYARRRELREQLRALRRGER